jgi:hypothetical protein
VEGGLVPILKRALRRNLEFSAARAAFEEIVVISAADTVEPTLFRFFNPTTRALENVSDARLIADKALLRTGSDCSGGNIGVLHQACFDTLALSHFALPVIWAVRRYEHTPGKLVASPAARVERRHFDLFERSGRGEPSDMSGCRAPLGAGGVGARHGLPLAGFAGIVTPRAPSPEARRMGARCVGLASALRPWRLCRGN